MSRRKITIEEIQELAVLHRVTVLDEVVIDAATPILFECSCGDTFKRAQNKLKRQGLLCNKCSNEKS